MASGAHLIPSNAEGPPSSVTGSGRSLARQPRRSPLIPTAVLLALLTTLAPRVAGAEPFTIPFQLTVVEVIEPSEALFGIPIPLGAGLTGAWTLDSSVPDRSPEDPTIGQYSDPNASLVLAYSTRSVSVLGQADLATIIYPEGFSEVFMQFFNLRFDGNPSWVVAGFLSGSPLSSDAFPSRTVWNDMSGLLTIIRNVEGGGGGVQGLGHVIPEPVPEPSSLLLFATGVAAIGRRAWKRRREAEGKQQDALS